MMTIGLIDSAGAGYPNEGGLTPVRCTRSSASVTQNHSAPAWSRPSISAQEGFLATGGGAPPSEDRDKPTTRGIKG